MLSRLLHLVQQLHTADQEDRHSSIGRSWSGGHLPLLTSGGGLATGADMNCPERQMEEAHAGRANFSGMSFAVGS